MYYKFLNLLLFVVKYNRKYYICICNLLIDKLLNMFIIILIFFNVL